MKILTVCSGLDFVNYTRRATIEAIHKLNPEMDVLLFNSILNIRKSGTKRRAHAYLGNFWDIDLADADVVAVYLIPHRMGQLESKLRLELRPGARVISNGFVIPNWEPEISRSGVHLYVVRNP